MMPFAGGRIPVRMNIPAPERINAMNIVSNSALSSALSLYRTAQDEHRKTLGGLSTGRIVATASDNTAYWAISRMMAAHGAALATSQDAVGLSQAMADIAMVGLKASGGIVTEIRSKLLLAASLSGGRDAVDAEIGQLKEQLKSLAAAGGFAGQNWLEAGPDEEPGVTSLVASVRDDAKGLSVRTIDHDLSGAVLIARNNAADGLLTRATRVTTPSGATMDFHLIDAGSKVPTSDSLEIAVSDASSPDEIGGMVNALDRIIASIAGAAARTGVTSSQLSAQDDYLACLQDSISGAMGALVDADLEDTAARLRACEIQAKLQGAAANMVNENSKVLLSLLGS